jgi:hypothetical protein
MRSCRSRIIACAAGALLLAACVTTPADAARPRAEVVVVAPAHDADVTAGALLEAQGLVSGDVVVGSVQVAVRDRTARRWLRSDGSWSRRREWIEADGTTAWTFAFTPPLPGEYELRARALDGDGRRRSRTVRVRFRASTAAPGGPSAAFDADAPSGPAPHVVRFSDASTGAIDAWQWDFGDGAASSEGDPLHAYPTPGTFVARLTVSGPGGTDHAELSIHVQPTAPEPPPVDIGEFVAFCPFSHALADDPIVFPGEPGRSHDHSFFGSRVVDAFSVVEDLLAGDTTCDPVEDRSSYWVPALWNGTERIEPEQATFYYLVDVAPATAVRPFPIGLRVIAGNAHRHGPDDGPSRYKWSCRGAADSSTGDFVVCPAGHELELLLNFPDCWNGSDLDSPDHQSHMAYSAGGACPPTHPVPVPRLQYKLRYPFSGGPDVRIASGRGYTAHADFWNAWEPAALAQRTLSCLHPQAKCGADGTP